MYARLWWKEMRVFWPIWVAIGVIAAGVQWFLLWSKLPEFRTGFLIVLGLSWSTLYALAVGAGVLAGERESKTQVFLDTLPVGRRMLWTGKVSFAVVTTLGLTLALTVLGVMGTAQLNRQEYPLEMLLAVFGLVLLEGVAWSLLWSVVLGSSLQAALLGLLSVGFINGLLLYARLVWKAATGNGDLNTVAVLEHVLSPIMVPRLVLAGAALGCSWLVFTHGQRPDRSGWARQMLARPEPEFGRLMWETVRESRRIWMLLAGAWIGLNLVGGRQFWRSDSRGLWAAFGIVTIGVPAGVSVFGPANRAQTYRFLTYHGVRAGRVWRARLVVWGIVMTSILSVLAMLAGATWGWSPGDAPDPLQASSLILEGFVVGVLAGQAVRRSITAWVVATLAFVLLVLPQLGLYSASMIPIEGLAVFPALVLTISRAWTGDWMNDLRGARRWLRLGGMMGAAAVLWGTLYIGYRAWSVPDVGPPFPPGLASAPPPPAPAPGQDAGPDYMRLFAESRVPDVGMYVPRTDNPWIPIVDPAIVANGWDPNREPVVTSWAAQRSLIEPIRHAAAKPAATFPHPERWASLESQFAAMSRFFLLLGLDNFERRSRGDLAGAWDDLRAALQISNQLGRARGCHETAFAATWRTQILQWALVWAGDSRQTSAQLRAALAEIGTLLRPVSLVDSLKDEYTLRANMLRGNSPAIVGSTLPESAKYWWERARALRVLRLLYAQQRELSRYEPWQRNRAESDVDLHWYFVSTPLVRRLIPNDILLASNTENSLLTRALEQVAALRIWQLEHGGHYPEALEALVPGILPRLPLDPYSGQPFRYCRARGQKLLPLGQSGLAGAALGETRRLQPTQPGQWLLYSFGPNRFDNEAMLDYETNHAFADLIFPLPPESRPEDETRERGEADKTGAGSGGSQSQ